MLDAFHGGYWSIFIRASPIRIVFSRIFKGGRKAREREGSCGHECIFGLNDLSLGIRCRLLAWSSTNCHPKEIRFKTKRRASLTKQDSGLRIRMQIFLFGFSTSEILNSLVVCINIRDASPNNFLALRGK